MEDDYNRTSETTNNQADETLLRQDNINICRNLKLSLIKHAKTHIWL